MNAFYRSAQRLTFLQGRSFLPRFRPDGAKIVFSSRVRGRSDIYQMNVDGSDPQCLTTGEELYGDPAFTPDSTKMIYLASDPMYEESHNIYLMNADGTEPRALTATNMDAYPSFSPDGQEIAFLSGRDRAINIYRMRADGTDQQCLTCSTERPEPGIGPSPKHHYPIYTPDGKRIVFASTDFLPSGSHTPESRYVRQPSQIYSMRSDGTDRQPLYSMDGDCSAPMFSPTGDWLAFEYWGDSHEKKSALCLIRLDGTDFVRLPDSHGVWPAFHPQGCRIVFSRSENRSSDPTRRTWNLYCVGIDDLSAKRLTDGEANDKDPSFSPDGTQIVFCSNRDGFDEIYTMPYED